MKFRAKSGMLAASGPVVWAGIAGILISSAATTYLIHRSQKSLSAQAPVAIKLPVTQPAVNLAVSTFHSTIQPILQQRCYQCHSGDDNKTGVAFDALTTEDSIAKNPELWLKVLKNTRSHIMPPTGQTPPTAQQQAVLENWIEYSAFGVDAEHLDPGRQTIRRLNRTEYHNTILDLTGVDFDTDLNLPADDIGYGFDNIGDVLNVSPMLMEKYMQAAQAIIAQAVPLNSKIIRVLILNGNKFSDAAGNSGPRNAGTLDLSFFNDGKATHTFTIATAGDYRISLDWNVKGSFNFLPQRATVTYSLDGTVLSTTEFGWHDDYNGNDQIPVHWSAGKHTFTITVHPAAPKPTMDAAAATDAKILADAKPSSDAQIAVGGQTSAGGNAPSDAKNSAGAKVPTNANGPKIVRPPTIVPSLSFRVLKVSLQGPADESKWLPAPGYTRIFPRGEASADPDQQRDYAREILGNFATRAFRRPVPAQTMDRLVDIAMAVAQAPGGTFEKGISQAMVAILASPRFLYRVEAAQPAAPLNAFAQVDEYSLASRLSYFLWSTMPDEELFKLAAAGQLRKNLYAQVTRMLADPKSQQLVENFTGQWLQSREAATIAISPHEIMLREGINVPVNQQMPGPVRTALKQEPEACFAYIMHGDRSVNEFLDSNYVFVNQALAGFYNMPAVNGNEMRKVTLEPGNLRGGALTMGATLVVTSNPTRTSPVKRGKWVLENILGAPTPPPPPDIPALEVAANQFKDQKPTLRQILAAHRANPLCASCHDRMDPLGLSMENFNAEGLYRKAELSQPIDASGQLATGEKFKDVNELKQILVKNHLPEFYRCLTEKMLIYATGRGMEYYDMPTIDKIAGRLEQADGRFSALLFGVIDSAPFQEQRVAKQ